MKANQLEPLIQRAIDEHIKDMRIDLPYVGSDGVVQDPDALWDWLVEALHARFCGQCNQLLDREVVTCEELPREQFCCDECMLDSLEELRVARMDDQREYEIWGDDYDSWYR